MAIDPRLERARALLREQDEKKNNPNARSSAGGDNASYPFWDIPENGTATLRFVPDLDDTNPWFWVERQVITLPFEGIVGGEFDTDKQVFVKVPCVDMFQKNTCPIIAETRPWWDNEAKKGLARQYYKKRSYIFNGFVVSSPLEETTVPENPIRRFILGSALLQKIKAGLADPDMEHFPTDYLNGCDFRVRKTKKGEYNNYDTSEWARRSRPLSEAEQIAIDQHGPFDLKQFLGPRPDADGIEMIRSMFHSSLAGEPFDVASYGKNYRAFGGGLGRANSESSDALDSAVRAAETTVTEKATEVADVAVEKTDGPPSELIAKLRARTGNKSN